MIRETKVIKYFIFCLSAVLHKQIWHHCPLWKQNSISNRTENMHDFRKRQTLLTDPNTSKYHMHWNERNLLKNNTEKWVDMHCWTKQFAEVAKFKANVALKCFLSAHRAHRGQWDILHCRALLMWGHRDPSLQLSETSVVPSRVAQSYFCTPFALGLPAAQLAYNTNPTSLHFALSGIPAAASQGSGHLGATASHFGPWHCLSPRDHRLQAVSSLPAVAKARETHRYGTRILKFLQFEITGTHIHIKTIKDPSSHMLLSLTLLHTCSSAKGGDKLSPQKGDFSHISKPCFKHTGGKWEQPGKKNEKITKPICFGTNSSPVSVMNILQSGQCASSTLVPQRPIPQAIDKLMPLAANSPTPNP